MSDVASQPFDAYHKWLGIPPTERPPTWYRLLGIPPFESDPDVIDAAADQRMTHLRKYQTGANSALSQQLLNEVASARIGLLSPERKAVYDAQLRAKTAAAGSPVETKPATERGKAEPSSTDVRQPPKLPKAVALDPRAPAAPAPVPAASIPVVMPRPVNPVANAPASAPFTPVPVARAVPPAPKRMTPLIVGVSAAAVVALGLAAYWFVLGPGARPPVAAGTAGPAEPKSESHATDVPAKPAALPSRDPAKVPVRVAPPSPPMLLGPPEGAVLADKGRAENEGKSWDFHWSPVAQAVKYHLRIIGPGDNEPLIDNSELTDSSFHCKGIVPSPGADRRGWRWKVRAMVASQTWTDWSPERKFDVQPEPPPVAGPIGPSPRPDVAMRPDVGPGPVGPPKERPKNRPPVITPEPETPVAETPSRAVVPDEKALAKASKEILDIYGAERDAARSPAQKVMLARKLLEQATASSSDPAAHYVLVKSARDLAAQASDTTLAFQAIDELNAAFDVDGATMKVDVVNRSAKAALAPAQLKALVEQTLTLMDELAAQDRFDDAMDLAKLALERARRIHDGALSKQVNQRKKEVEAARKDFAGLEPLVERLGTQPDDAEANYRLGRYRAAIKGDWKKALPMLAKGSDASWKKLAQQELASPSEARDQLALANGWWDAAQSAEDAEKNGLLVHAGVWYRKAQPDVPAGLEKARVVKRLAEIDQLEQPSHGPESRKSADFKLGKAVDILKRVNVARDQVAGQWKRTNDAIAGTGAMMARTRLMLPVAIDGSYDLQIVFAPINRFDQVVVAIPLGSHGCAIYVGNTYVGIYAQQPGAVGNAARMVDSQSFRANNLPRHVLGISVRLDGDTVKLAVAEDGVMILTRACQKDSLDVPTIYAMPSPGHPGLGTTQTDTAVFGAVTLRMVSGKAFWTDAPAASQPAEAPDALPNDRPANPNKPARAPSGPRKAAPGGRETNDRNRPEIPDLGLPVMPSER